MPTTPPAPTSPLQNPRQLGSDSAITIPIAGIAVSDNPAAILVTYSLGSCVAVLVYEPTLRIGGMVHIMLPASRLNPRKAQSAPGMFADTGIPALFHELYGLGCGEHNLIVKLAGGGHLLDESNTFALGARNIAAIRDIFARSSVPITAEDVGGTKSRSVHLHVADGRIAISSQGEASEL